MTSASIRVEGATELRAALRAVDADLPKLLAKANKDAAQVVVDNARPPVRSGKLKGSMKALGSQRSGRARAGSAGVPYAGPIHWGRGRGNVGSPPGNHKGRNPIRGRPFLTEAADRSQGRIVDEYEQMVRGLAADVERRARG